VHLRIQDVVGRDDALVAEHVGQLGHDLGGIAIGHVQDRQPDWAFGDLWSFQPQLVERLEDSVEVALVADQLPLAVQVLDRRLVPVPARGKLEPPILRASCAVVAQPLELLTQPLAILLHRISPVRDPDKRLHV
jgi:hypothetical protein